MSVATEERTVIEPHAGPQEAFLATEADIAIYGGAAGGGKTWGLLVEPLRHIGVPGFGAVIFRRTSPQVTQEGGMWDESQELYPHLEAEPRLNRLQWVFPANSRIRFGHMQYEADKYDWKGAQICLIEFDQLEEFTEGQFFYLLSRNRSTCGVRPYIRASANPVPDDDATGGWLAEFISWWIDQESGYPIPERGGVVRWFVRVDDTITWGDTAEELQAAYPNIPPKSVTFIPAKLEDNPTLQEKDPGYLANLMALSRVERLRLHGGNWKVRAKAGEVFDEDWFTARRGRASDAARVRYWDKAGTEDGGKFTAGVLMARTTEGLFWIEDVVRGQWSALKREQIILETAESDGPSVHVWVEQEPGSGGKESAEATVRMLAGYIAHADRVTGDKVTRAQPLSAQAEAGNVVLTAAPWNRPFLRELHSFPDGKFKDQADAASGAFNKLSGVYIPVEEEYDFAEEGGFVL